MANRTAEVEEWIESNHEWFQDYFLKKADMALINKWLLTHGHHTVHEFVSQTRRGSCSQESSGQTSPDSRSPDPRAGDNGFFSDKEGRHHRSNSKKHLRHDFARSKMRNMFRTCDNSGSISQESLEQRRSSLKGMRQFLSLPPTSVNMLSLLIQSKVRLPRYASKDEELKRELRYENERDFFLEIVKDVSHDLDLKSLTSRIILNICILLDADRSSLFFVEGPKGKQMLVSKVFDVYTGTNCLPTSKGDNIVRVPWGQGIIGQVAEQGKTVNITNASQDPRYNNDVDRLVCYKTDSLLCMPIRNADDEIIGVAQVIKGNGVPRPFTQDDEKVLETYLTFCGMAISNAQAIEAYTREYDRNKALLEVVHDLFEEQTSVEKVVTKIMQRAQSLLKCERCIVMLREQNNEKSGFSQVYDLQQNFRNSPTQSSLENSPSLRRGNKIAEIVATTGETVNIADTYQDSKCDLLREVTHGSHTKSILCKPIRNNNFQTIGVAQLINKLDGNPFDEADDELFEAFTIFCGLGINNCLLYDEVAKAAAKQAVALEVLSYHATVPPENVLEVKLSDVPEAPLWRLNRLDFDDFSLNTDEMVLAGIRIFQDAGLIKKFKIEYETLCRWLLTVRKNYRNIAYHNWRHAFNVCQFMFSLMTSCGMKRHLSDCECLGMIVACLCHDLDHRGTNNAFQQKSGSPLSQLYGTQATLEHHHFNHAVMILNSEGHNLFANVSSQDYGTVMKYLKHAILATDLSLHIQVRSKFFPLVESGQFSWEDDEQREVLRSIFMTASDIATITKPWEVQRKVADLVVAEFFDQGDKERNMLKIEPPAFMDRKRQDELPRLQMDWCEGICLPLFKNLAKMDNQFQPLLDRVLRNKENWETLESERLSQNFVKETGV